MKSLFTILTALIIFPTITKATAQEGDILIWKGDTLKLFSNPLALHPNKDSIMSNLFEDKDEGMSTACWRGYIAEWKIIDNELYLTNIFSCTYYNDSIKADLAKLFGPNHKNGKVKADWVTGNLLVPKGKLIYHVHNGYGSIYESEIEIKFKKGKLVEVKKFDNSKSHRSVFTTRQDTLQKFIYSQIQWEKLPDLKNKKTRVVVSVFSGSTQKPDSINLLYPAKDERFNKEAVRVLKILPDWDVLYKHGEIYRVKWTIPIFFNEEKRKQYAR